MALVAATIVLDGLVDGGHAHFGIETTGRRLEAEDLDWTWGAGQPLRGLAADLIAALSVRTLPSGRLAGSPLARSGSPTPEDSE